MIAGGSAPSKRRTAREVARIGARAATRDDRAVSPVVGKILEATVVVLYLAVLATVLYGGVVPEYRAAAGAELGDRVLAEAAVEVQGAVPEPGATARVAVDVPETIHGEPYRVRAVDGALVLEHPHPEIGDEQPIAAPPGVDRVEGAWNSTDRTLVLVEREDSGRVVRLANESSEEREVTSP